MSAIMKNANITVVNTGAAAAKEYLEQVVYLKDLLEKRIEEKAYWDNLARSVSGSNFEPRYDPNCPTEGSFVKCLEKVEELQGEIAVDIFQLAEATRNVNSAINALTDCREQLLLRYRYVDGLNWDEVCNCMKISKRTVYRIHDSALSNFRIPE